MDLWRNYKLWDFKFSWRRVWCSELSSGLYCRVKWLSTDVSEVCTASIIREEWWWRQYAPLKCRPTIILHGSTTQRSRVSSGSIVSDYGLGDRGSIPGGAKDFSSSLCVQTGSGAHPASCTMGTGGPFPGGKARPGRDADHSPPSSSEVVNE
jgi:hypothetical protein